MRLRQGSADPQDAQVIPRTQALPQPKDAKERKRPCEPNSIIGAQPAHSTFRAAARKTAKEGKCSQTSSALSLAASPSSAAFWSSGARCRSASPSESSRAAVRLPRRYQPSRAARSSSPQRSTSGCSTRPGSPPREGGEPCRFRSPFRRTSANTRRRSSGSCRSAPLFAWLAASDRRSLWQRYAISGSA